LVQASGELSTEAWALQSDLKLSQTQYANLLKLSKETDAAASRVIQRCSLEVALWRVGAFAGTAGCAGALLSSGRLQSAAIGVVFGAAAGIVWWMVTARSWRFTMPIGKGD
jgi:hypothetical protein